MTSFKDLAITGTDGSRAARVAPKGPPPAAPQDRMTDAVEKTFHAFVRDLATAGGRHDAMCRAVLTMVRYEDAQYDGATTVLERMRDQYVWAVTDRSSTKEAGDEFDRALKGARVEVASTPAKIKSKAELAAERKAKRDQLHADVIAIVKGVDNTTGEVPDPAPWPDSEGAGGPHEPDTTTEHGPFAYKSAWATMAEPDTDPGWLARDVITADAYGVLGAEHKAGKTWAIADLMVSVATGTAWMGHWDCTAPGPVLAFLGEGSERKMRRRFKAVARAKGIDPDDPLNAPIDVVYQAPNLGDDEHIREIARKAVEMRPKLIIVDPSYLSMPKAETSSLTSMGAFLGRIQTVAQAVGSALLLSHHWNKGGSGSDSKRLSGAGFAEWGRFLISVKVTGKKKLDDGGSLVRLIVETEGDEIAGDKVGFVRTVWEDIPGDLSSAMHYRVEQAELETDDDEVTSKLGTRQGIVVAVLQAARTVDLDDDDPRDGWRTPREIAEAAMTKGLTTEKVRDVTRNLANQQVIDVMDGASNRQKLYRWTKSPTLGDPLGDPHG